MGSLLGVMQIPCANEDQIEKRALESDSSFGLELQELRSFEIYGLREFRSLVLCQGSFRISKGFWPCSASGASLQTLCNPKP